MTEPTDDEIDALVAAYLGDCGPQATRVYSFVRAVLAKWGTPPAVAGEPVFAFRRKGFANFCTCTEERYAELSAKPNLFETRIFYTTPPAQADSQPAPTGEPWHGHQFKEVRHGYWQCDCGKAIKEAEPTPIADKDSYPPLPSRYTYDDDEEELFSADQMLAFADSTHALRASHGQAPAQAAPAYKDSTPELHVGDSAFESWYSAYNPAHKSDKQRAHDAYAAGMGDPLVMAAPAAVAGLSEPKCSACGARLQEVTRGPNSYLSADQFDADKLGDWFCECCPEGPNKGSRKHRYFDNYELAAPTTQPAPEPMQVFESPRASTLMRAWQEGWEACRDSEFVGEDAQNEAFNRSNTVNQCVAEDMLAAVPTPQPAPQQEAQEPALFVSAKQLAALTDPDDPDGEHGRYLPVRKTSKGLFTQALYTAPQPSPTPQADSVTAPADGANWQDISTAPKDGTRFVAVGNNYGLYSEGQHTCIAQWFRGCWMDVSEWNETSELKYLTHWMPLLPLPGSAARKKGANHD